MNFDLDQDERALKDGVRQLCDGRVTSERVRQAADHDGVDRALFRELAEAGVFSLRLDEAAGGLGLGMTHATIVYEELGRALVPGPIVDTHLAAGLIDGAATGDAVVVAVSRGATPIVVPHLAAADAVVVVDGEGLWSVSPGDLTGVRAERPLDPLSPVHHVVDLPQGDRVADAAAAGRWRREGSCLRSAMLLGLALGSLALAVGYAKEREQFGRAIGSFQAVKHLCADMLTRAEVARAAVYAAACTLDDPGVGDVDAALATASLLAGEAAERNGKTSIQVHGGMGFTWEVDAHLYLKRAMVLMAAEDAGQAAEVLAGSL